MTMNAEVVASVTAVLAVGWALPYTRDVFTSSPAASITSADLLWAVTNLPEFQLIR